MSLPGLPLPHTMVDSLMVDAHLHHLFHIKSSQKIYCGPAISSSSCGDPGFNLGHLSLPLLAFGRLRSLTTMPPLWDPLLLDTVPARPGMGCPAVYCFPFSPGGCVPYLEQGQLLTHGQASWAAHHQHLCNLHMQRQMGSWRTFCRRRGINISLDYLPHAFPALFPAPFSAAPTAPGCQ